MITREYKSDKLWLTVFKFHNERGVCLETVKTGKGYKSIQFSLSNYAQWQIKKLPHFFFVQTWKFAFCLSI